jgi:hypothetical protein
VSIQSGSAKATTIKAKAKAKLIYKTARKVCEGLRRMMEGEGKGIVVLIGG